MPRRGGQSMRKRGGSGTHKSMRSGSRGHQAKHRRGQGPKFPFRPWSTGHRWPDVPTFEEVNDAAPQLADAAQERT